MIYPFELKGHRELPFGTPNCYVLNF